MIKTKIIQVIPIIKLQLDMNFSGSKKDIRENFRQIKHGETLQHFFCFKFFKIFFQIFHFSSFFFEEFIQNNQIHLEVLVVHQYCNSFLHTRVDDFPYSHVYGQAQIEQWSDYWEWNDLWSDQNNPWSDVPDKMTSDKIFQTKIIYDQTVPRQCSRL